MKIWVLLLAASGAYAQAGLDACDSSTELRQFYDGVRNARDRVEQLRAKLAGDPENVFLNRWYLESPQPAPGGRAAAYKTRLEQHPDDPRYLYFYGAALLGADSPQGSRLLEQAIEKAPEFPLPYFALAQLYGSGDFKDGAKAGRNMLAFSKLCPAVVDAYTSLPAVTDVETLRELTARFRKAIEGRETVGVAQYYPRLWAAEFRAYPGEFDRLREQVRRDMARAKELYPDNVAVQAEGYRLLGDAEAAKALAPAVRAPVTANDVIDAWLKEHPYPTAASQEEKDGWTASRHAAAKQWVKDWPDEPHTWYWLMVTANEVKPVDLQLVEHAGEAALAAAGKRLDIYYSRPYSLSVAQTWALAGIRLKDSIALARAAIQEMEKGPPAPDDRRRGSNEAFRKQQAPILVYGRFEALATIAEASRKLDDFAGARSAMGEMKAWLDEHPADRRPGLERLYFQQEALYAIVEGRKLDALTFYQRMRQQNAATTIDTGRARELWADLGGSKETFETWWTRPAAPPTVANQPSGKWTPMDKSMASLKVADLAGRSWTVAEFKGKTTFINVWATWCEPCRRELPQVQALFDRVKDRKELQVVTIAIDENPGVVPPFLKTNGYTFPVLLAKGLVDDVMPEISIPRNWIVDSEGRLRGEYVGFDSKVEDWPGRMLEELERVANGR